MLKKGLLRSVMMDCELALHFGAIFGNTLSKMYGILSNNSDAADSSHLKWQKSIKNEIT